MSEIKGNVATKGTMKGNLSTVFVKGVESIRIASIKLYGDKWEGSASPYSQAVTVPGVTENSKIDLSLDVEQAEIFYQKDVAFVVENDDGMVTVYCIGQKPTNDYTLQATITEVVTNG